MNEAVVTADQLLEVLSRHIGASQGASIHELARECQAINALADLPPERHLRKLIEALRLDGQHICAHPEHGYFMASSDDELQHTCAFLYARAMTSLKQIGAMKRIALPDLAGQLKLRT